MSSSNPLTSDFPSFSPEFTHYKILGVAATATPEEIKAAYDELGTYRLSFLSLPLSPSLSSIASSSYPPFLLTNQ